MRIRPRAALATAVLALAASWPAEAKQPHPPSDRLKILPDESESFSRSPTGRVSNETGFALALYRPEHAVKPGTPEAMARQYLREAASQLGLRQADLSDLAFRSFRKGLATTAVRFEQLHKGVPVYGGELKVSLNQQSVVIFVMNGYRSRIALEDVTPRIAPAAARARALAHLGAHGPLMYDRNELVVYPGKDRARLAFRVTVEPRTGPFGTWESLVDAHTGELFRVEDLSCYGTTNGTATVFNPDPLSSSQQAYGGPWSDIGDADNAELNGQRATVTLRDIDTTGGFTLRGPWAEIQDFETPNTGLFTQGTADFSSTRSPQLFEAAMTYFHIDTFMRYMNDAPPNGLGVAVTPTQYVGGVRFDPHGLGGADNSHYLPGTGQVSFGEGGVDDDEDADVIIHELGHGIHHWLQGGSGPSQVQGLSEGTGDYLAQSYSRAFNHWPSSAPAFHWVFSWDGHNEWWGGRTTNYPALWPGGLVGQVHTDGQIWATANMRIWNQLGRQKTDTAFLEGLNLTTTGTNQDDAAQAVLNAAAALGYTLADRQLIHAEYTATGYTVVVPVELMGVTVE